MEESNTFVLSTEEVNSYNFRILTLGIDLEDFKANPVMLYQHERGNVIGKWNDISVNDQKHLLAKDQYDMKDPFAVKIANKVKDGFIKCCSIGLEVLDYDYLDNNGKSSNSKTGILTVTKSKIYECSIVDIGSNKGAVRLKYQGKDVPLNLNKGGHIELASVFPDKEVKLEAKNMDKIIKSLGLSANSSEQEVLEAVNELKGKVEQMELTQVNSLIELGKSKGFIDETNEAKYKSLAKLDYKTVSDFINSHVAVENGKPTLVSVLTNQGGNANPSNNQEDVRKDWTLDDWRKKDPEGLGVIRATDPLKYELMVNNNFKTVK